MANGYVSNVNWGYIWWKRPWNFQTKTYIFFLISEGFNTTLCVCVCAVKSLYCLCVCVPVVYCSLFPKEFDLLKLKLLQGDKHRPGRKALTNTYTNKHTDTQVLDTLMQNNTERHKGSRSDTYTSSASPRPYWAPASAEREEKRMRQTDKQREKRQMLS